MVEFITLQQAKMHLRIDHDDEDDLVKTLIDAVFDAFETSTNRKLYAENETIPDDVPNGIHLSKSITQGAFLLLGHWYANRESVVAGSVVEMPMGTKWLWSRHKWWHL
ncbi:MAG: head-tail connector protein [Clostridia bacterium]